jgi:hypothetical protein
LAPPPQIHRSTLGYFHAVTGRRRIDARLAVAISLAAISGLLISGLILLEFRVLTQARLDSLCGVGGTRYDRALLDMNAPRLPYSVSADRIVLLWGIGAAILTASTVVLIRCVAAQQNERRERRARLNER